MGHGFYGLAESQTKSLPEMLHEPFVCLNWTEFTGQREGERICLLGGGRWSKSDKIWNILKQICDNNYAIINIFFFSAYLHCIILRKFGQSWEKMNLVISH